MKVNGSVIRKTSSGKCFTKMAASILEAGSRISGATPEKCNGQMATATKEIGDATGFKVRAVSKEKMETS